MENTITPVATVITPEALLEHWQGHRKLTRRLIEAFPENELFHHSIGGMRPFSDLAVEMITMGFGVTGLVNNVWPAYGDLPQHNAAAKPGTKEGLLALWDEVTQLINDTWPNITLDRFQAQVKAFGQYEGTGTYILLYFIDNEIHHRGQGYVYLRSLGITPPPFWDRQ
ncbi:MAG TPA: DinB family protein [Chitinophaga sp.]|uniref:DinB family protein n=1 Tax=Chitinophaga sp. TaxID=1869181 RepID=UPI002B7E0152|nr:DinB family protein [Chitinophaga sp.]HVI49509.1 DinB family protein [Chitinophaga sp.]